MSTIDTDALLQEVASEAPCGDDLEYDPAFGEMERAAQGKPEQQFGDTLVPAEDPDWRDVKKKTLALLERTKDLRVGVHLTRAVLHTDGLLEFCDCLTLIRGMVEQYWESVHPQLDPDDDNDPTLRVNTIATLIDPATTLRALRETPVVRSRSLGRFSLHDIDIAKGDAPPRPGDEAPPEKATIEAAFLDCDLDELQATAEAVRLAGEHVQTIEAQVTEQVGAGNAVSFEPLVELLADIHKILAEQLVRRGVGPETAVAEEDAAVAKEDAAGSGVGAAQARPLTGDINSRQDVIRVLNKVCQYYERHEPSSPLPLLIRRAQRLASKSFLEIIRDLAPNALDQATAIGGPGGDWESPAGDDWESSAGDDWESGDSTPASDGGETSPSSTSETSSGGEAESSDDW